ncbi:MAG: transporter [Candidatus Omnitrophota bacterium]|jgi:hypothetical protein
MRLRILALAFSSIIIIPNTAAAVNFYDGVRAPKGLYFLTYSTVYAADKVTDSKGRTAIKDYDLLKVEELLRFCYYSPDFVFTALLPAGGVHVGSTDKDSFGLGDASIGGGWFLPVKEVDILPMLFVKIPTGEYASDKSTNYGTHQVDIRPVVFFHKTVKDFSMDAAVKYFFRLENDKSIAPGDELHLQYLLGYNVTKDIKLGPSVNWMLSRDKSVDGVRVPDSARQTLSVGAEFYTKFSGMSFDFSYLYDAFTENAPKGHFFQLKSCYKF